MGQKTYAGAATELHDKSPHNRQKSPLCGLYHAVVEAYLKVHPFIITLCEYTVRIAGQ